MEAIVMIDCLLLWTRHRHGTDFDMLSPSLPVGGCLGQGLLAPI